MQVKINGKDAIFKANPTPASLAPLAPAPGMEPIVNGRRLSGDQMTQPLQDGAVVEYAAQGVVKASLGPNEQRLVLRDLEDASRYFVDLYGPRAEFDVDFDTDEEYIIINNFRLPRDKGYLSSVVPLLIPLSGFSSFPPPGVHVPTDHPDTAKLAKGYSIFKHGAPPYSRTHDLTTQGWAWLCLRKMAGSGDGWNWRYKYTTGGPDTLKDLMVMFDAFNREV